MGILKVFLFIYIFAFAGCGDRYAVIKEAEKEVLSVKSTSLNAETNHIVTDENYVKVTLLGKQESKLFINEEEVGIFAQKGLLEITFDLKNIGDYTFEVYSQSITGVKSEKITIKVTKEQKSASLGTVQTTGDASSLTVSKEGIIFIAQKDKGVEVISIGFNDVINTDLLATIDSNAQDVILSKDESRLYIKNENGKFHVMDISDINNPILLEVIDTIEESEVLLTEDGMIRYRVADCGLVSEDISNPHHYEELFVLEDETIEDAVLINGDTQMITAHGKKGLRLYDLSDKKNPDWIGFKSLGGSISGLSLLKKDGILFVANGEYGVEVFNLERLVLEMNHVKILKEPI